MQEVIRLPPLKASLNVKLSRASNQPIHTAPLSPVKARLGLSGKPLDTLLRSLPVEGRYRHKYAQALGAILSSFMALEPVQQDDAITGLCLPRNDQALKCPTRYKVNDIGPKPWVAVIDWLCRKGFIEHVGGGYRGQGHFQGLTGAYVETIKLRNWIDQNREHLQIVKFTLSAETIHLTKGDGKTLTDYEDDETTEELRSKMRTVNSVNHRHHFELPGAPGLGWYSVPPVLLEAKRVFRDDFRSGGRVFSTLQQLSKDQRKRLRIDGYEVVELDYSSHQPRMLYHLHGLDAPEDCYAHPEIDRSLMKSAMVKVMNCKNRRQALGVLRGCLEEDTSPGKRQKLTPRALLEAVWNQHPLIRVSMGDELWKRLHYLESCIAVAIMEAMALEDRPCLGIHDSFVVAAQDRELLHHLMVQEYQRHMGGYSPIIKAA